MKSFLKKLGFFLICILIVVPGLVRASMTDGTIDVTFNKARIAGTVGGYINFRTSQGNVHVTDSAITGYAWGENVGWINLNPTGYGVINDGTGTLSGYAWGDHIGWINFKPSQGGVSISSSGVFSGWAWGERVGWISFNCATQGVCSSYNYKVATDWRPQSVRDNPPPDDNPPPPGPGPGGCTSNCGPNNPPPPTPSSTPPVNPPVNPPPGPNNPPINPPINPPVVPPVVPPNNPPIVPIFPVTPIISNLPIPGGGLIAGPVGGAIQYAQKQLAVIYQDPVVDVGTKIASTVGVVVAAGATAIAFTAASFSLLDLIFLPLRLWSLLSGALGLKKRSRPWGTVYDSITKQPLDPAYVVLQDMQGNEVSTSITDLDGRYGFLVPQGIYTMVANKTNYTFPSQRLVGRGEDELYNNLYFGGAISVRERGDVINKNIPLDPQAFDWNEFTKRNRQAMRFYSTRDKIVLVISDWFFRLGFVIALVGLFAAPAPYNYIIAAIYIILLVLRRRGLHPRTYGFVVDKATGDPLSFAVIRIISPIMNNEIIHKVTDQFGRYYCLAPKGTYTIRIERKNQDESYTLVQTIEKFQVKSGIINQTFKV